jgi:hypothetical protein
VIFVPAPNCAQIAIRGVQSGQPCEMTIGAQHAGAYTLGDLNDLTASVDAWVNTDLLDQIGNDCGYTGVSARGLASLEDLESILDEPLPGGSGNVALPANVALCVTKRTGYTGRSARGRMYMWGVPIGAAEDVRHISNAANVGYTAIFDNLLAAIVDGGWTAVVISKYSGGVPRTTATVRVITALEIRDNRLDTQRRRLGKV